MAQLITSPWKCPPLMLQFLKPVSALKLRLSNFDSLGLGYSWRLGFCEFMGIFSSLMKSQIRSLMLLERLKA
ncbi:hypothetical protein YC2023_051506 [Brassica napus]